MRINARILPVMAVSLSLSCYYDLPRQPKWSCNSSQPTQVEHGVSIPERCQGAFRTSMGLWLSTLNPPSQCANVSSVRCISSLESPPQFHSFLQLPLELRTKTTNSLFIIEIMICSTASWGPHVLCLSGKSVWPFSEEPWERQRALEGTPRLAVVFECSQTYLRGRGDILWQ